MEKLNKAKEELRDSYKGLQRHVKQRQHTWLVLSTNIALHASLL